MNKSKTRAKVKGKNSEHKWKKSDADFSMPKIAEAAASLISPETAEINALATILGISDEQNGAAEVKATGEKRPYEVIAVKKLFTEAHPSNHFFVSDGSVIKNVVELIDALEKMHEDTYKFHANEEKNDFSSWVKDVFGEHNLAENLKSAASKADAQLAVAKSLLKELL